MDGNLGFGTIVEKDVLLGSTETEGTVALGGNLTFGPGYNVMIHSTGTYTAPGESEPTALLVGGKIDTATSAQGGVLRVENNGYVHVGDMTGVTALDTDMNGAQVDTELVSSGAAYDSSPRVQLTTRQTPSSVGPFTSPIDFTALFTQYRQRALDIAACPQNVTLADASGATLPEQTGFPSGTQAYVTLTPGETNVLHLTGDDLNNLSGLTFRTQPNADTPFVVVVDPTDDAYSWHIPELAGVSGTQAPYMLWDFPHTTDITITSGDSLEGTIYAPNAHLVDLDSSNIEGDIAVESFEAGPANGTGGYTNAGEIHDFPFNANLDCAGNTTPPTTASSTTTGPTPTGTGSTPPTVAPASTSATSTPTPTTPTTTPTTTGPTSTPTPTPTSTPTTTAPTTTPTTTNPTSTPTPTTPTTTTPTTAPSPTNSTPAPTGSSHPAPAPTTSGEALAQTGLAHGTLTTMGALAATALLGGGVLFTVSRRRRSHRH
jgi:choice-of-anchor A domain-containing protein